jgi:hypothetical protein
VKEPGPILLIEFGNVSVEVPLILLIEFGKLASIVPPCLFTSVLVLDLESGYE